MIRRIPANANRETVGLQESLAREDELRSQGYRVETRVRRIGGVRMVCIYSWER